ncbi:MAG TPA: hypothetical protein GXZ95_04400 [Mollicutes bacterium]|nr:hypothetical protein [Mollicutes bacterium]
MDTENKHKKIEILIIILAIMLLVVAIVLLIPVVAKGLKQKRYNEEITLIEEAALKITAKDEYKEMLIGYTSSITLKELLDKKYLEKTINPYTDKPFDNNSIIYITKKDDQKYIAHYEYRDNCLYNNKSCLKDIITKDLKGKSIKYQNGAYYKGTNETINNNYLWFSGQEYRIMGINSDGTIKLVTSLPVVSISWGKPTKADYVNSYARKWLNILPEESKLKDEYEGVFYKSLNRPDLIKEYSFCIGSQDPTSDIDTTCNTKVKDKIGLLTWWEYVTAGPNKDGTESYLDIKDRIMFSTTDSRSNDKILVTDYTGSIFIAGDSKEYLSKPLNYGYTVSGIRPVINLIKTVSIASGSGTKNDPYRITGDESGIKGDLLTSRYAGEYINIGKNKYRIVSKDIEGHIKVVSDTRVKSTGTIKKDVYTYFDIGNSVTQLCSTEWPYEYCNNKINITDGSGEYNGEMAHNIGYFLNSKTAKNSFYNNLGKYKDYIVEDTYFLGKWSMGSDYKSVYESSDKITLNVGMLHYGEMLAGNNLNSSSNTHNYWLISPYNNNYEASFISVSGNASNEFPNAIGVGVRPVLSLKTSIKITSGDGTTNNPYEIDVN